MPQPGAATAMACSALRYADSAMAGMRMPPGALTTAAGGAENVVPAKRKSAGGLAAATTANPLLCGAGADGAASGVPAGAPMVPGAAATAPARTTGVMTAMPNAGARTPRPTRRFIPTRPSSTQSLDRVTQATLHSRYRRMCRNSGYRAGHLMPAAQAFLPETFLERFSAAGSVCGSAAGCCSASSSSRNSSSSRRR